MHRYRIIAQISLILSILNLILAAPMVLQEIHEARGDDSKSKTAVAEPEDVPVMPEKPDELEATSTPLPPSSDSMASPQHSSLSDGSTSSGYPTPYLSSASSDSVSRYWWLLDRPPRLNLDIPASLQEPAPSTSGTSEVPLPASLHESASPQPSSSPLPAPLHASESLQPSSSLPPAPLHESTSHQPSSSPPPESLHESAPPGSPELPFPAWYMHGLVPHRPQSPSGSGPSGWWEWTPPRPSSSGSGPSEIPRPMEYLELPPGITQSHHLLDWLHGLVPQILQSPAWWEWPTPHPSQAGSESSEISPPPGSDWGTSVTYSPQDRFTPSHHLSSPASTDLMSDESMSTVYSSASGGSLSSHYYSASGESLSSHYYSASGESVPSHHSVAEGLSPSLAPDGPPPSPTSPPTETPPDDVGFFNKNVMKKIKIAAGVTIIGGIIIASITGSQIKNRDCQDS